MKFSLPKKKVWPVATTKGKTSSSVQTKPLSGRRIVITRARSQAGPFARALEDLGGNVIEFPTIEIVPPDSYNSLDQAIQKIEGYDWIIFTSVNGVASFLDRWKNLQRDSRVLEAIRIAAIGPDTAQRLQSARLHPQLVPREYRAEAILEELKPEEMRGKRVLLPRAAEARDILPYTLREWGAEVDVVEAYRTVAARSDGRWLTDLLRRRGVDMVTFTSSSTVSHFAAIFREEEVKRLLSSSAVACIGPITQRTAEDLGLRVDVVARDYTIPGLTQAIVEYFRRQ